MTCSTCSQPIGELEVHAELDLCDVCATESPMDDVIDAVFWPVTLDPIPNLALIVALNEARTAPTFTRVKGGDWLYHESECWCSRCAA